MTLYEIREKFKNDRFATENGAVVEDARDGYALCSLKIEPKHKNALGAVMGGVYFMLADFAFAVASNCGGVDTVSLGSNISFLGSAKGDTLKAEAKCVKNGKSTCNYTVEVTDSDSRLVAEVTATGFHLQK